ncbi:hypothetical protein LguiA_035464 [Lonicera macranthoides]
MAHSTTLIEQWDRAHYCSVEELQKPSSENSALVCQNVSRLDCSSLFGGDGVVRWLVMVVGGRGGEMEHGGRASRAMTKDRLCKDIYLYGRENQIASNSGKAVLHKKQQQQAAEGSDEFTKIFNLSFLTKRPLLLF